MKPPSPCIDLRTPIRLAAVGFALTLMAMPVAALDPPAHPDLGFCPADSPPGIVAGAARTPLAELAELDRIVRQGCPPRPLARAWFDAWRRLAPFDQEPDPDSLLRAAQAAAALPTIRPAGVDTSHRCAASRPDWTNLGPRNITGRINTLAVDPRDEAIVYAGAASGGVWKSVDAGASWRPIADGLPSIAAGAILLDPTDPDRIWFGTGEGPPVISSFLPGAGVFRSTDGGENWEKAGEPLGTTIMRLAYLPGEPPVLFAAAETGIHRSTDGGDSWRKVLAGSATDVIAEPGSTASLWAALGNIFGEAANGVYRSTDRGASWSPAGAGAPAGETCGRISLAASPLAPGLVYAGVQDATTAGWLGLEGLYRTSDGGASWTKLANAPDYCSYPPPYDMYKQCFYNNTLVADADRRDLVLAGGIGIYRSGNAGASFSAVVDPLRGGVVHSDQHALVSLPGGTIWVGNDGGVYRSTDYGLTWENRSLGIVTTQYYGLAQGPGPEPLLLGGLQDNGSLRWKGEPDGEWRMVFGGDGGPSAIDPTNPKIMFAQSWSLDIQKSTTGGAAFLPATNGIPPAERNSYRTMFIAPIAMDAAHPSTLIAGTWRVWRTTDGAANWQAFSPDLSDPPYDGVSALAVSPAGDGAFWAGTSNGRVWVNRSGLADGWVERTNDSLPTGRYLQRVTVDPSNADAIWLGYWRDAARNVYRSSDGGLTWLDASGNLPETPVSGLAVDPKDGRRVWAGTEVGVFITENGGQSWSRWGSGFPNARAEEILFQPELRRLRVATHGRGVWEVSADAAPADCDRAAKPAR